ncbi:MAG: ABC transporter permease [Actinobacteria bacterium]|nr:ABC transporter permease [Actinomycetota bacterium]
MGSTVRRNWIGLLGLLVLLALLAVGLLAPMIARYDPNEQSLRDRFLPPAWSEKGMSQHPLGTDELGRDVLSRLLYGARATLLLAGVATAVTMAMGTVLGLIAGYFGSLADRVIMRAVDSQLALPYILLGIVVMSLLGKSTVNLIAVLVLSNWATLTRIVRAEVLSVKQHEFVQAAYSLGASRSRIVLRHILPNVINPVIVVATTQLGMLILIEASLSFLGLGLPESVPTWGSMLTEARNYLSNAWWLSVFPGALVGITVIAVNLVGDWARDMLDPGIQR